MNHPPVWLTPEAASFEAFAKGAAPDADYGDSALNFGTESVSNPPLTPDRN